MYYYLIINEGLENGLIRTQVIDPIVQNNLQDCVRIISFEKPGAKIPRLSSSIKINTYRFGIPYKLFLFNVPVSMIKGIALCYAIFLLLFKVRNVDTVIARSYFPALVCYYLKRIKGVSYIFDTRSLFLQENLTKKNFRIMSKQYINWLKIEKKLLENAQTISTVSLAQEQYYKGVVPNLHTINIPCYCSNQNILSSSQIDNFRQKMGFLKDDIIICYYGSLDNGWNNINYYLNFFIKAIEKEYKICIISQDYHSIKKDKRFSHPSIHLVDAQATHTQKMELMQSSDYGVIIMPKTDDSETRLGVKFVEYAANGLGLIIGEFVGEAVRYGHTYFKKYSYIYKGEMPRLKKNTRDEKLSIIKQARELFGVQNFIKMLECDSKFMKH